MILLPHTVHLAYMIFTGMGIPWNSISSEPSKIVKQSGVQARSRSRHEEWTRECGHTARRIGVLIPATSVFQARLDVARTSRSRSHYFFLSRFLVSLKSLGVLRVPVVLWRIYCNDRQGVGRLKLVSHSGGFTVSHASDKIHKRFGVVVCHSYTQQTITMYPN